tara:strand:+ start:805 stop:1440 length:636 start_codon:yes stop_codon:yes gene_type:complete
VSKIIVDTIESTGATVTVNDALSAGTNAITAGSITGLTGTSITTGTIGNAVVGGGQVGQIICRGGTAVPTGFLYCDGSAVSRSTYSSLFAVVSENFGQGDNSTTFNLPDLRGFFVRGQDDGSSNDPDDSTRTAPATGANTGDNVGSYQADQFKAHTHTRNHRDDGGTLSGSSPGFAASSGTVMANNPNATGSTGANQTNPKNVYVRYYIKF